MSTLTCYSNTILYKYLQDTKNILEKNGIEFWLDCGTLLGAIRDKELISWDKDIDLGCWKSKNDYNLKQKLKNDFRNLGYNVYLTDYWINIHHPDYTDLNLDINFYTIDKDNAITPSSSLTPFLNDNISILVNHIIKFIYNKKFSVKRYNPFVKSIIRLSFNLINLGFSFMPLKVKSRFLNFLIHIRKITSKHKAEVVPKYYFEKLITTCVFGGQYTIPEKSKEYLEFRYGKSWEIPEQQWDTLTQDATVKDIV